MSAMRRTCGLAVPAAALLVLAGCAVMQIDVDVYKGPLANHEDVQVQEFVTLARGAKPLLIELRNRIEWASSEGVPPNGLERCAEEGFRSDPDKRCFTDSRARRVNAVLSLYDDLGDPGLARFVEQGSEAFSRLRDAEQRLRPDEDGDRFWDRISTETPPS